MGIACRTISGKASNSALPRQCWIYLLDAPAVTNGQVAHPCQIGKGTCIARGTKHDATSVEIVIVIAGEPFTTKTKIRLIAMPAKLWISNADHFERFSSMLLCQPCQIFLPDTRTGNAMTN